MQQEGRDIWCYNFHHSQSTKVSCSKTGWHIWAGGNLGFSCVIVWNTLAVTLKMYEVWLGSFRGKCDIAIQIGNSQGQQSLGPKGAVCNECGDHNTEWFTCTECASK